MAEMWKCLIFSIQPTIYRDSFKKGVKYAGCTVHYVSSEIDDGEILDQSIVKVCKNDNEQSLSKKILIEEHKLYIKVLKNLINKELVWVKMKLKNTKSFLTYL